MYIELGGTVVDIKKINNYSYYNKEVGDWVV